MNPTFQTLTIYIGGTEENQWKVLGLSDAHARILEDIRWEKNKRYGLKKEGIYNFLNSIDPFVRYYVSFTKWLEGSIQEYEVVQVSIPQEPMKTFEFNDTPIKIRSLLRTVSPSAKIEVRIPAVSSSNSEFNVYGSQREEDMKLKHEEDQLVRQKEALEKQLLEVKQKLAQYR